MPAAQRHGALFRGLGLVLQSGNCISTNAAGRLERCLPAWTGGVRAYGDVPPHSKRCTMDTTTNWPPWNSNPHVRTCFLV